MNYKIVTKYIKELSFKIPDAKSYFLLEKNIKNYEVNFDIKSKKINESVIEVDTNLKLVPQKDDGKNIEVKVLFSSLINFEKDEKIKGEELEKIILTKVPEEVYPDIRSIFVFLFEKCGFKKINLEEKIDFEKLYKNRMSQK